MSIRDLRKNKTQMSLNEIYDYWKNRCRLSEKYIDIIWETDKAYQDAKDALEAWKEYIEKTPKPNDA